MSLFSNISTNLSNMFGFNSDPNPNADKLNQFMKEFVPDSSKLTKIDASGVYEIKGKVNLAMLDMLKKHLDNSGNLNNAFLSELRQAKFTSDPTEDAAIIEKAAIIAKDIFNVSTPPPSPAATPAPSRSSRATQSRSSATTNEVIGFDGKTYTAEQEKAFNVFIQRFANSNKASLKNLQGEINKKIGSSFLNSLDQEGRLNFSQFMQSGGSRLTDAVELCEKLLDQNLLERQPRATATTTTTTTTTTTVTPSVNLTPSSTASVNLTPSKTSGSVSIADLDLLFANYSPYQRDVFNLFIRAVKNDPTASITNIPNDPITKRMSNSFFKSLSSQGGGHNAQQFQHDMRQMEDTLKANQVEQFDEMMAAYKKLMDSGQIGTRQ